MSVTFKVFYIEISGNAFNYLQEPNILLIFIALKVFNFDISGKDVNEEQP